VDGDTLFDLQLSGIPTAADISVCLPYTVAYRVHTGLTELADGDGCMSAAAPAPGGRQSACCRARDHADHHQQQRQMIASRKAMAALSPDAFAL